MSLFGFLKPVIRRPSDIPGRRRTVVATRQHLSAAERLEQRTVLASSLDWFAAFGALASDTATDAAGNVYVVGGFSGSDYNAPLDFDPGPGEYSIRANNGRDPAYGDAFLVKLNDKGDFQWVRALTVPLGRVGIRDIEIGADGTLRAIGSVYSQIWWTNTSLSIYAPESASQTLATVGAGLNGAFACSFTTDGNCEWFTYLPYSVRSLLDDAAVDASQHSTVFGSDSDSLYRLSDDGIVQTSPLPYSRLSDLGGSGGGVALERCAFDQDGNMFLVGRLRGGADFDPSENVHEVYSTFQWGPNPSNSYYQIRYWSDDVFIAKYSAAGAFEWVSLKGASTTNETVEGFSLTPDGDAVIATAASHYNTTRTIYSYASDGLEQWSTAVDFDYLVGLAHDATGAVVLVTRNGLVDIHPYSDELLTWRHHIYEGNVSGASFDGYDRAVVWSVGPVGYGSRWPNTRMDSIGSFPIVAGTRNNGAASSFPGTYVAVLSVLNEAPTGVSLANTTTSLPENTLTSSRIKLADIVITDDAFGTNSLSLSGTDADSFEIDDLALYLKAGATLNYEAKDSYAITVSVADNSVAGSTPQTTGYALALSDVDEHPTDIALSAAAIAENLPVGTVLDTLMTTDVDSGDAFVYTLVAGDGDDDNSVFQIVGNALQTAESFNYEAKCSYSVRVRSTDAGGLFTEKSFTITVTDVNEAFTSLSLANTTASLPENTPTASRIKLAEIVVTDDGLGTNSLSLSGVDAESFEIGGLALYLKAGAVLNYEAKDSYTVTVSVADTSLDGSLPLSTDFTLAITTVNEIPTDIALSAATIAENQPSGSVIGTLTTTDVDSGDAFIYTLVAGDGDLGNGAFLIVGNALQTADSFDHEAKSSYSVRVRSTDVGGLFSEKSFTITVTDLNEAPTRLSLANTTTSLPENTQTSSRIKLADIVITDDALGTNSLSLSGADADGFETDGLALYLKAGAVLNYEAKDSYAVTVSVADSSVESALPPSTGFTLGITNVNEIPTDITLSAATIAENQSSGSVIGALTTTDVDAGDAFVYTLVAGDGDFDNSVFQIVGHTLQTEGSFNYEAKSSYSVRVRSTDAGGLFTEKSFTIIVTDVNEAPTGLSLTNTTTALPENTQTASRIKLAEIVIADDALGTNSLTLSGADADSFEIDGIALYLKAGRILNYEAKYSYAVTLSVADTSVDGSTPLSNDYTLAITNVNENLIDIALSAATITENQRSGSVVGTLTTTDVDSGDTFIYTLVAGDGYLGNGVFLIVDNALKTAESFNYEAKNSVSIRVRSTDAGGLFTEKSFTITVTDVNEAPTAISLANTVTPLPENTVTTNRIKVADIVVTDDALGTNSLSLFGVDAANFEIDGFALYLKAGTALNFEAKTAYSMTVSSQDSTVTDSSTLTVNYSLAITDVNEAPTAISLTNTVTSLPENTATTSRIKVADIVVTDDALGTNSLSLSGVDAANFEIDGFSLYLKAGTALNFEAKTTYSMTLSAQDSTVTDSSTLTVNYSLVITDVNEAPTAISLTNTVTSLPENTVTTSRIKVADIVVTDDDLGTNSLSLSGVDAANFEIDGFALYLKAGRALNFEAKTAYSMTVSVQDSNTPSSSDLTANYSLAITDVNEAPTALTLTNTVTPLPENTVTTSRIKVADIVVTDDALGTNSLSLSGVDAANFEIDGFALYLKAGTTLNFEAKTAYSTTVSVQDSNIPGSSDLTANYGLTITDVPEASTAPRVSAPAFFTVVEDKPTALVFAAAPFSDSDSPLTKLMTVTLTIPAGILSAPSAGGVTAAGTATARTLTGTLSDLNSYFTALPGRVIYTPARNATASSELSITIAERHGGRTLTSRGASQLQIVAVNDAPVVFAPARFGVREDTRTNVPWPASPVVFTDVDSRSLTVTVSVPDGSLFAATAGGVRVTGTPTARILTGSPSELTAYFKTLGRIAYLPALDNTAPRTLTTTVTDGIDTRTATSTIAITSVNDAPRILAAGVINGSSSNLPVEISYDTLRAATGATDAELPNPTLVIQTVLTGTLQRWSGIAWVRISTTAGSPVAQRTLQPGQRLRWIPPSGSTGLQNAFRVTASDGVATAAAACKVRISIA
jgi:hypothetical protein